MPQSSNKTVIAVKNEATYGVDSVPTAADAVLCSNLKIVPLEGSSVDRDFMRPYFGASGQIRIENFASITFDTEIAGSGAAGTAPEWGSLFKASNFSETITAAPITGTAQAGGNAISIKLAAAASGVDDFYTGMSISITGGTGSGQAGEIISYTASTKIATLAKQWSTPPDATTAYSIGANVMYQPNSNFGIATANTSAAIYFYMDGVRHILLGARGTPSFDLSAKVIPKISWKFTGLLGTITDTALLTGDFTGWKDPVTVSTANTTDFNLLGFNAAVYSSLKIDIANVVKYRQLVGSEWVSIGDRKPTGSISMETVAIVTKDWWSLAKAATTGTFCIKHGQTAGNIVGITAPKVVIANPKYSESDGVAMIDLDLTFIPYSAAGNDEIRICCK